MKRVRFILCLAVATLVVLPQIWAYLKTPEDYFFSGINLNVNINDIQGVYFSAIDNFSQGDILYRNPFDSEGRPFFFYPAYLVIGKIAALTSIPVILAYHLSAFLITTVYLLFVFRFLELFFVDFRKQLLAFSLICFGGLFLTGIVEGVGLFSFFIPHFILSQLALFSCLYFLIKISLGKFSRFSFAALFICIFLLSSIHPWMSVVLITFSFIWFLVLFKINKKNLYKWIIAVFILIFGTLPIIFYYSVKVHWVNFSLSTPLYFPITLYGIFLPVAIIGVYRSIRRSENYTFLFLATWFVVQFTFIYLPFPFSRRFVEGMYLPLSIFSVVAVDWLISQFNFKKWEVLIYTNAFIYLSIGVIANFLILFLWLPNGLVYRKIEEKEANLYLDYNSTSDQRILSLPSTSLLAASQVKANFYVGHGVQTPDFEKKQKIVQDYLSGATDEDKRLKILYEEDICYVFVGPEEKKITKIDLASEDYLSVFYQNKEVTVHKTSWC